MKFARLSRALVALGAVALVGWSMIWQLDPDESGVVLRFGKVARSTGSGITVTLPWPIERLERVATSRVQTVKVGVSEDPAQDELLSPTKGLWLTGDTNILLARLDVQIDVADPVRYVTAFQNDDANEVVRMAAEASITERLGSWPVDDILRGRSQELIRSTQLDVQATLDALETGIRVRSISVDKLEPPTYGGVSSAFRAVETARQQGNKALQSARAKERASRSKAESQARDARTAAEQWATRRVNRANILAERVRALSTQKDDPAFRQKLLRDAALEILGTAQVKRVPADQSTLYLPLAKKDSKNKPAGR